MGYFFQYDVLLVHNSEDIGIVRGIAERLSADGLRVGCEEQEIRPGYRFTGKVQEGLTKARMLVLCRTPQADGEDGWTAGTFQTADPLKGQQWVVYLALDRETGEWPKRDPEYPKLLAACRANKVLPFPSHGGSLSANVVSSRKLSFMIPGRNFPPRRPTRRENVNESIRVREVRAVFPDGTAEVMPTAMALRKAQELGLDLVLVSPTAVPPVAKAIDYGHYQYEQKKKQHDARKKQHVVQVKELKFRPNTDDHDYDFKKNHAIRFLKEGNRVKAVVQFRGREIAHTDLGKKLLVRFAEDLATFGAVEGMPRLEGRNAHILISPVKAAVKPEKGEKHEKPHNPEKPV